MGPPSRESKIEKTAAIIPEITIRMAAGLAMADPAPSQPGPRSTAIKAVVWSCEPAEKIVLSGTNKPTIKALKNAHHTQPTDRLVVISLREAGSPSVTLPTAISKTRKRIVIVQVIGTVLPIIRLGKTIHAAKTHLQTQPPY